MLRSFMVCCISPRSFSRPTPLLHETRCVEAMRLTPCRAQARRTHRRTSSGFARSGSRSTLVGLGLGFGLGLGLGLELGLGLGSGLGFGFG